MPLAENEVGVAWSPSEWDQPSLAFTSVTSCFTLTVALANGWIVGGHLSLAPVNGRKCNDAIREMQQKVRQSGSYVVAIYGAGMESNWDSNYFNEPPAWDGAENPDALKGHGEDSMRLATAALQFFADPEAETFPAVQAWAQGDKSLEFTVYWDGQNFSCT